MPAPAPPWWNSSTALTSRPHASACSLGGAVYVHRPPRNGAGAVVEHHVLGSRAGGPCPVELAAYIYSEFIAFKVVEQLGATERFRPNAGRPEARYQVVLQTVGGSVCDSVPALEPDVVSLS